MTKTTTPQKNSPKVEIYSIPAHPLCDMAKEILRSYNIRWHEIDISRKVALREEMIERSGGKRSIPQIIINNQPIGDFDDIARLDINGELAPLLQSEGEAANKAS